MSNQNRIVIPGISKVKKRAPLNPKVGISEAHYEWLNDLASETGKTCAYLNNLFYDHIRKMEIVIERHTSIKEASKND